MDLLTWILKALSLGALGGAAVALLLSYKLVHHVVNADPPSPERMRLAERFMLLSLVLVVVMVVLQVTEGVLGHMRDSELADLRGSISRCQERVAMPPPLNRKVIQEAPKWSWHWGAGGWETSAAFLKQNDDRYSFAATTMYKGPLGHHRIIEWRSKEPFEIADETKFIEFLATRDVVAKSDVREKLNLGPAAKYSTRIKLKKSWALTGSYTGPDGEGPAGGMALHVEGN